MKHLYIITIELDEDSVYFTEMTASQSKRMAEVLLGIGHPFKMDRVKDSPGFHSFDEMIADFKNW